MVEDRCHVCGAAVGEMHASICSVGPDIYRGEAKLSDAEQKRLDKLREEVLRARELDSEPWEEYTGPG